MTTATVSEDIVNTYPDGIIEVNTDQPTSFTSQMFDLINNFKAPPPGSNWEIGVGGFTLQ